MTVFLTVSSPGREKARQFSGTLVDTDLFTGLCLHNPVTSHSPHLLRPLHLGLGFQHMDFGGTKSFSPLQAPRLDLSVCKPQMENCWSRTYTHHSPFHYHNTSCHHQILVQHWNIQDLPSTVFVISSFSSVILLFSRLKLASSSLY